MSSPAAVCQCLTLVSLCTSIADPNWIQVRNATDPDGPQRIYGVAYTLHAARNLTDTGPLGGVNGWGMWLLYALAGLCYGAVLASSATFLLHFLGGRTVRPRLLVALHLSTVVLLLSILGVWAACLYVIYRNTQGRSLWAGGGWGSSGAGGVLVSPGDSFYIAALGLLFACLASAVSISELAGTRGPHPCHAQGGRTEGEEAGGEPGVTDPLIPRQLARGEEGGEDWGE